MPYGRWYWTAPDSRPSVMSCSCWAPGVQFRLRSRCVSSAGADDAHEFAINGNMSAHGAHVLLVEDDRDTREMYSEYLSYSGMHVTEARTGRRALETLQHERPDVVVTDYAMPEMDGRELSRRLRADETTSDLPIIAASGQLAPD